MKQYLNLVISLDNQSFYIEQNCSKPWAQRLTRGSALGTLQKIGAVIRRDLLYIPKDNIPDGYSKMSREQLSLFLKNSAGEIREGYLNKNSRVSKLNARIARRQAAIEKVYAAIHPRFPSPKFHLPDELIQEIFSYFPMKELFLFREVNQEAKRNANDAIIRRAVNLGFENTNGNEIYFDENVIEAKKYLAVLFNEMGQLCQEECLHKHYVVYRNNQLDEEATLKKLKTMTARELFFFFLNRYEQENTKPFPVLDRYLVKYIACQQDDDITMEEMRRAVIILKKMEKRSPSVRQFLWEEGVVQKGNTWVGVASKIYIAMSRAH